MDLVVIPLLLIAGIALTFIGINGLPGSLQPPAVLEPALAAVRKPMLARVWVPRIVHSRPATITQVKRPETVLDDSDLLLSDVLSELMKVREELSELRSRVDALSNAAAATTESSSTPRRRTRKPATVPGAEATTIQEPSTTSED